METQKIPLKHRPMALIILDGWGYSENPEGNAILSANKPTWDALWANCPHTLIGGSGLEVGLPENQMGNSEVGHLNLGAGRVVYQEYTRIDQAIKKGLFNNNKTITSAVDQAVAKGKAIHILGLLSPGGVHSDEQHLHAMIKLAVARGARKLYLHAFLDGRDTAPQSAHDSLKATDELFSSLGTGKIASIVGRYFAMDRDQRWPRTQAAYELITSARAEFTASNALEGLEMAYQRGETDEFVKATAITVGGEQGTQVNDGDVIIFMNFRADRARQLTEAFTSKTFEGFERASKPQLGAFVTLTEYKRDFDVEVAFPPEPLRNVFGEYISGLGLRQLRIAETEKYAHVTFFFNGGEETPFPGEDRTLIPSPHVDTYDLQPEMNAPELTDKLVAAIESGVYDAIICNYANPDMVGHTGKMEAAIKAIETIDSCLGRISKAIEKVGGELLITADHGNAEQMCNKTTGQPHTAHTSNLVPFIYMGRPAKVAESGTLSDIAPTMLYLMGLEKPAEMDGNSLVECR